MTELYKAPAEQLARVRQTLHNTPATKLAEVMGRVKSMNLKGPKYSEIFNEDTSTPKA
jgi:hypothetical protein